MAKKPYDEKRNGSTGNDAADVSDEDRAAAARVGLSAPETAHDAAIIRRMDREKRLGEVSLTLTMNELCDAVGWEVKPASFAADALERIAEQIDAEGDASADEAGHWHELASIATRARFAATVARKLHETLEGDTAGSERGADLATGGA